MKVSRSAFTLVELLVVICIVAILIAIILPMRSGPDRLPFMPCMNNQKQIALGTIMWNTDNTNRFPWELSSANSGTKEFAEAGYAAPNFRILSDYLKTPFIFVCPTDKVRTAASNVESLKNQNISYFLGIDAVTNPTVSILTGDRHLKMNGKPVGTGLMVYDGKSTMDWTRELHDTSKSPYGVVSFLDGHCERFWGTNTDFAFRLQGTASKRFVVP